MPSTNEHITRAKQNLEFAQSFALANTKYIDWAVTAYFYAALHWVDALLCDKEYLHPADHQERNELVQKKWYLRPIRNEYRTLKDRSEDARYEIKTFTSAKVENEIIPLYRAIEQHILQQLPPLK